MPMSYVLSFERFISLETSRPIAIDFIAIIIEVGEMLHQILGQIGSLAIESSLRVIMGKMVSPLFVCFFFIFADNGNMHNSYMCSNFGQITLSTATLPALEIHNGENGVSTFSLLFSIRSLSTCRK